MYKKRRAFLAKLKNLCLFLKSPNIKYCMFDKKDKQKNNIFGLLPNRNV